MEEKKDKRSWHGIPLSVIVLLAIVFMLIGLSPVFYAVRVSQRFNRFTETFGEEALAAETPGGVTIRADGEDLWLPAEALSSLHYRITLSGMGKERKKAPDTEEVLILFPDGATLSFRPTTITEKERQREKGTYIRFVGADGWEYAYDTDQFEYATVRFWMGLNQS